MGFAVTPLNQSKSPCLEQRLHGLDSAASMIGGTAISTTSASGLRSRVFQYLVLNRWRPMYVVSRHVTL